MQSAADCCDGAGKTIQVAAVGPPKGAGVVADYATDYGEVVFTGEAGALFGQQAGDIAVRQITL